MPKFVCFTGTLGLALQEKKDLTQAFGIQIIELEGRGNAKTGFNETLRYEPNEEKEKYVKLRGILDLRTKVGPVIVHGLSEYALLNFEAIRDFGEKKYTNPFNYIVHYVDSENIEDMLKDMASRTQKEGFSCYLIGDGDWALRGVDYKCSQGVLTLICYHKLASIVEQTQANGRVGRWRDAGYTIQMEIEPQNTLNDAARNFFSELRRYARDAERTRQHNQNNQICQSKNAKALEAPKIQKDLHEFVKKQQ